MKYAKVLAKIGGPMTVAIPLNEAIVAVFRSRNYES